MSVILVNNDPFGKAVFEYRGRKMFQPKIEVFSSVSGKEFIKPSYLFRNYNEMPELEKLGLENCRGKILDVGACAGSHSLYLQDIGFDVTALEISDRCCVIMNDRGVKNVENCDFFTYNKEKYDTLLLLMNGIGIAGTVVGLRKLLQHCRELLNDNGRIIFDSSDIDYIFTEKDGSKWVNLNSDYYGEVEYRISYKKEHSPMFKWLFIDAKTMATIASEEGFYFTQLAEGKHYDYLGMLRIKSNNNK